MLRRLSPPAFFLLLFVPLAALIAAGAWVFADADYEQRLSRREAQETSDVALSAGALERALGSVADDVVFLALLPRLQEAIAQPSPERLERLSDTFRVFANAKRTFDQIRWIDESGRERVRVVYDGDAGRARVVAQSALQDKSGRYYFTAANRLEIGDVYLSPFDLSVEAGAVERPFKPTLRLATPLAGPDGARHGIVILDVAGRHLIERMVAAASDMYRMQQRLLLLNREGYWLRGTHGEDEWGFMLGQSGNTMEQRHPDVWPLMQASALGQALIGDGLWTWRQVYPLRQIRRSAQIGMPSAGGTAAAPADDYVWTLAARLPADELAALRDAAWQPLAWPLPLLGVFALIVCGFLTRYRGKVVALDVALRERLAESEASNRQLAAQERFIRTITDHLPSKVSYWDTQLRCRYANTAYLDWFGKQPGEMLGVHVRDVLGESSFAEGEAAMRAALAGQAQRFERCVRKFDGSSGWLLTNYIPDRVGDRVDGFYVLSTDISEIRQAGAKLAELNSELSRRVDEVLAATRAKDDFLSNMSHEIRTPLNAILGLAYLLDSHALAPEERDLVRKIRGAGRLLLGIISDILDYSKIEAGRLEIEHVPFRLGDVLDGVAAIMSTTVGDKDIELTVDAVPVGAGNLLGDALRLGQVLNNLVSNAIKFTERGSVALRVSQHAADGQGIRLRFAVCDSGIGIAADKQALIFEAFAQADSSTTRQYGGTGLGLSISRYLVRQMGGELGVSSTPGQGSEFWFTLPFDLAENGYALPSMALQRVLVVDDSAIARDSLCAIVQSLGWSAEAVDSGAVALERCRAQATLGRQFDLLLIDWLMPGMDGLAASKTLRADRAVGQQLPIIAMVTAHSREALLREPDAAAADLVLSKPVTASMLYNAIAEAKRRRGLGELRPAPVARSRQLPGLRVLVVDDVEINCEVAARILEGQGAHVQTVADGQAALDWLREWPDQVDVVLMDVQMPLMDGYEATRRIRGELGRVELPVVALTAGAFSYQREAALAAGMNDFLAKPFDVDAMIVMLQRLTGCQPETAAAAAAGVPAGELAAAAPLPVLPGIDVARGLRAWGGDVERFRKYLHQFAASYAQAGRAIAASCRAGDTAGASALAHKLSGAAGNLALSAVERAALEIDAALPAGQAQPSSGAALPDSSGEAQANALQFALDTALASLARWDELLGSPPAPAGPPSVDAAAAAPLLRELLLALDRDNPRHAEPILAALAACVPAESLRSIGERIDAFDFRAAEAQSRAVAATLGILLEQGVDACPDRF